jgi:hypothetical protein
MKTYILSRLSSFAVALMMNGLIIAGVSYLFNGQLHQDAPGLALAQTSGGNSKVDELADQ